jgi:hypothetical protein
VADLNGDGLPEVVVSGDTPDGLGHVTVLRNDSARLCAP